jgi:hypothetical protein
MHTTGRPDRLVRLGIEVVVARIMTFTQYNGRPAWRSNNGSEPQCIMAYMMTLMPTAYPFGEKR